jgi:hypothetical protein
MTVVTSEILDMDEVMILIAEQAARNSKSYTAELRRRMERALEDYYSATQVEHDANCRVQYLREQYKKRTGRSCNV